MLVRRRTDCATDPQPKFACAINSFGSFEFSTFGNFWVGFGPRLVTGGQAGSQVRNLENCPYNLELFNNSRL